jgi:hypothetical protein
LLHDFEIELILKDGDLMKIVLLNLIGGMNLRKIEFKLLDYHLVISLDVLFVLIRHFGADL